MGCGAVEDTFDFIGDIFEGVGDALEELYEFVFHGGLEDVIKEVGRWIDSEIIQPVYEFQKGMVNAFIDDPLYAAAVIAIAVTGQFHLLPYVNAIKTKSDGGSWGDALKAGVKTYVTQQVAQSDAVQNITTSTATTLQNAGIPTNIANAMAKANTAGLSQGTVEVATGGSFNDGYVMGASTSLAATTTEGIMGFVEDKLPEGFKFKQEEVATEGEYKGRVVDSKGRPVYERGVDGLDNFNKPIAGRTANIVNKTIPKVVQNIISDSLAAELRGEEITDALLANAVARTYITVNSVQTVMEKIPGVDFSSVDGQLFLSKLTPAIQESVVVMADMGLTEEAGAVVGNRLLGSIDEYSSDQLFSQTLDFLDNSEFVQDIMNNIDTLRQNLPNYEEKFADVLEATQKVQTIVDEQNRITIDRNYLVEDFQLATEMLKTSPDGAFYFKNQENWYGSFDENGEVILGSPASEGYTSFEDYHNTIATQQGFATVEELRYSLDAINDTRNRIVSYDNANKERINELSNELKNEEGTLMYDYLQKQSDLDAQEATLMSDIDMLTAEFSPLNTKIVADFVTSLNPSFNVEEYRAMYDDLIDENLTEYQDYAKNAAAGRFVSFGQRDAYYDSMKEQFRLSVIYNALQQEGITIPQDSPALAIQALTPAKLVELNTLVDQKWADYTSGTQSEDPAAFTGLFSKDLSQVSVQFFDGSGNPTRFPTRIEPEFKTLTEEQAQSGDYSFEAEYETVDGQQITTYYETTGLDGNRIPVGYQTLTESEALSGAFGGWELVDGVYYRLMPTDEKDADGDSISVRMPIGTEVKNDYQTVLPPNWQELINATGIEYNDIVKSDGGTWNDALQLDTPTVIAPSIPYADATEYRLATFADLLYGGGIGMGENGFEYIVPTENLTMFNPFTGTTDTMVNGITFDQLKQMDPTSHYLLTNKALRDFRTQVLTDVQEQEAYDEGLIDYYLDNAFYYSLNDMPGQSINFSKIEADFRYTHTLQNMSETERAEYRKRQEDRQKMFKINAMGFANQAVTNFLEFASDTTDAAFDPNNPLGLVDFSQEGVEAKFDYIVNAANSFEENTVQSFQTTSALTVQGLAELGQSFIGISRMWGSTPEDNQIHQLLENMIDATENWKSDEWQDAAEQMNQKLAQRGVDDPSTPENEAIWQTMQIIGGAAADHPAVFLGEVIFREGIQEIVPLVVGGGVAYGLTKTALGATLGVNFARTAGITAGASLDILESVGGTAEGAYTESYNTIMGQLRQRNEFLPDSSKLTERQMELTAEHYANDIAIKNATYAGLATTALLLAGGGLAADRLVVRNALKDKVNVDALESWGNKLAADFASKNNMSVAAAMATTTGKEMISEFGEEYAIQNNLGTQLLNWDPNYNVTGENWFAGTMGAIVAGPTTAVIAGAMTANPEIATSGFDLPTYTDITGKNEFKSTGNLFADTLMITNPNVAIAVATNSPDLPVLLNQLDITQESITALTDAANDPYYSSTIFNLPSNSKPNDPFINDARPVAWEPQISYSNKTSFANDLLNPSRMNEFTTAREKLEKGESIGDITPTPLGAIGGGREAEQRLFFNDKYTDMQFLLHRRSYDNVDAGRGVDQKLHVWFDDALSIKGLQEMEGWDSSVGFGAGLYIPSLEMEDNPRTLDRNEALGKVAGFASSGAMFTPFERVGNTGRSGDEQYATSAFHGDDLAYGKSMGQTLYGMEQILNHFHYILAHPPTDKFVIDGQRQTFLNAQDAAAAEEYLNGVMNNYKIISSAYVPLIQKARNQLGLGNNDEIGRGDAQYSDSNRASGGSFPTFEETSGIPYKYYTVFGLDSSVESFGGVADVGDDVLINILQENPDAFADISTTLASNYLFPTSEELYTSIHGNRRYVSDGSGRHVPVYNWTSNTNPNKTSYGFGRGTSGLGSLPTYYDWFLGEAVSNGWSISDTVNYITTNYKELGTSADRNFDFVNTDAAPKLSTDSFKRLMSEKYNLTEEEFYASLRDGGVFGTTEEDIDSNFEQYVINGTNVGLSNDAVDEFGNPIVGVKETSNYIQNYVSKYANSVDDVVAAYKDRFGENYIPTNADVNAYAGARFTVGGDGNIIQDLTDDSFKNINDISTLDNTGTRDGHVIDILNKARAYGVPETGNFAGFNSFSDEELILLIDNNLTPEQNIANIQAHIKSNVLQGTAVYDLLKQRTGIGSAELADALLDTDQKQTLLSYLNSTTLTIADLAADTAFFDTFATENAKGISILDENGTRRWDILNPAKTTEEKVALFNVNIEAVPDMDRLSNTDIHNWLLNNVGASFLSLNADIGNDFSKFSNFMDYEQSQLFTEATQTNPSKANLQKLLKSLNETNGNGVIVTDYINSLDEARNMLKADVMSTFGISELEYANQGYERFVNEASHEQLLSMGYSGVMYEAIKDLTQPTDDISQGIHGYPIDSVERIGGRRGVDTDPLGDASDLRNQLHDLFNVPQPPAPTPLSEEFTDFDARAERNIRQILSHNYFDNLMTDLSQEELGQLIVSFLPSSRFTRNTLINNDSEVNKYIGSLGSLLNYTANPFYNWVNTSYSRGDYNTPVNPITDGQVGTPPESTINYYQEEIDNPFELPPTPLGELPNERGIYTDDFDYESFLQSEFGVDLNSEAMSDIDAGWQTTPKAHLTTEQKERFLTSLYVRYMPTIPDNGGRTPRQIVEDHIMSTRVRSIFEQGVPNDILDSVGSDLSAYYYDMNQQGKVITEAMEKDVIAELLRPFELDYVDGYVRQYITEAFRTSDIDPSALENIIQSYLPSNIYTDYNSGADLYEMNMVSLTQNYADIVDRYEQGDFSDAPPTISETMIQNMLGDWGFGEFGDTTTMHQPIIDAFNNSDTTGFSLQEQYNLLESLANAQYYEISTTSYTNQFRDELTNLGYDETKFTDNQIKTFFENTLGQGGVTGYYQVFDDAQYETVFNDWLNGIDPQNIYDEEDIRQYLTDLGYDVGTTDLSAYTGPNTSTLAELTQGFTDNNLTIEQQTDLTKRTNTEIKFKTFGYNPSVDEIDAYKDDLVGIEGYLDARQFTAVEAEAAVRENLNLDPNEPLDPKYQSLVDGLVVLQGDENTQTTQSTTALDTVLDPFIIDETEVAAELARYGFFQPPADFDMTQFTGVNVDEGTLQQAVSDYVTTQGQAGLTVTEDQMAEVVTQADLDAVDQIINNNVLASVDPSQIIQYNPRYDVDGDGQVTALDADILNQLYAGEGAKYNNYLPEIISDTSVFADTGVFDTLAYDRNQAKIAQDANLDTITDLTTQINTQVTTEQPTGEEVGQQLRQLSMVDVKTPEHAAEIKYAYDLYGDSIFATPEQEGLFITPYGARPSRQTPQTEMMKPLAAAEGGLISNQTDELLKLLGEG